MRTLREGCTMDAAAFKDWRSRHRLTMKEAGLALGLYWETIKRYEAGERRVPRTVALLCYAYDLGYQGSDHPY